MASRGGGDQGVTTAPWRETSRRRRARMARVGVEEQLLKAASPAGSRFKGYEDFVVQDLVLRTRVIRSCPRA